MANTQVQIFTKQLENLFKPKLINWMVYAMVFSYFYNLPVFTYSVKGSNELRLYDLVGLLVLYYYVIKYPLINQYIKLKLNLLRLNQFLMWANITLIGTLAYSLTLNRPLWFIQTLLYLYHFWIFFLTGVFISIMIRDKFKFKRLVYFFLILVIAECVLVILQNLDVVPYLWSDINRKLYFGFLSGTMGPNKIVIGMTMLISFVVCVGLFFEKKLKFNKYIVLTALFLSVIAIGLSGSRTTYVGFGVFMVYFMFTRTVKFIYFAILIFIFGVITISYNFEIVEIISNVFSGRVIDKISDPSLLKDGIDVSQLYDDLGAGRKDLAFIYIRYLVDRPYIFPFGIGFNNRIEILASAHNAYLSLINEVGLVGVFLYFRWLGSHLFLNLSKTKYLQLALKGLIFSMLVTLFFGEHLYVYRPLFGLVGIFLFATVILTTPRFYDKHD